MTYLISSIGKEYFYRLILNIFIRQNNVNWFIYKGNF